MSPSERLIVPLEYALLNALSENEWPLNQPFRRREAIDLVRADYADRVQLKRDVGQALARLLHAGFIHRSLKIEGKQSYVQSALWSEPSSAEFLEHLFCEPRVAVAEYDLFELRFRREELSEQFSPASAYDAIQFIVRALGVSQLYTMIVNYCWVPAARRIFNLKLETVEEQRDRLMTLFDALEAKDFDTLQAGLPALVLQPTLSSRT